ncbi:ATP-dependent helicase HepA [bacterium BMS3Abin06]|nr:ATP-dependent helicase HepA [bacterium BMS3Abin06]
MGEDIKHQGSDLFIVDNSDNDWKVKDYLHDWTEIANKFDIATGYFEIGALLALDGQWQKLDKLRILMGDEVSGRTRNALVEGIKQAKEILDDSIEKEKENNDFLTGVPAIADAIKNKKIECRIYTKDKFHAKAYITHGKVAVVGSTALVGSSNFTFPGLTNNVELNVQLRREVELLQKWYERHWNEAEEISEDILKVIERHTREYTPFEVYARALQEFFRNYEMSPSDWEETQSRMYPVLDQYQKEGYRMMMKIAGRHGGAFICDGVGLGKTFVGLTIIERLIMHDRKRVALFVPKATRKDVWERDIKRYLPHIGGISGGDFSNLVIFNHTDLGRTGEFHYRFKRIKELADAIVIDEAHHFRNPGIKGIGEITGIRGEKKRRPSRYRLLSDLIDGPNGKKELFMLTATPVNNRLDDFRHMVELFTRHRDDYFKASGIHSLKGHFIKMERDLKEMAARKDDDVIETNLVEAGQILRTDNLFRDLVVQRSRAYVKESQLKEKGTSASFPEREDPRVGNYSIKKTYGRLLGIVEKAFAKKAPLFVLGLYFPLAYYKGADETINPFVEGRQKQVVGLIRTQFLKRFESSAHAFERSCERLLLKLFAWIARHTETGHEKHRLERWKRKHSDLIGYVHEHQHELFGDQKEEDADEDIISDEMLEAVEYLNRDEYKVEDILDDTYDDLEQICDFLYELRKFQSKHDDKLKALVKLLKNDPVLKKEKVLIFTEFAETARYLRKQLNEAGISGVEQIDSATKADRSIIIRRFAPYYNDSSSPELAAEGKKEIRILISTDVLSEGLNLQDAMRLINYDLHWNPVRLMQRIGRVDRRMNPDIEDKLLRDHPEQKSLRGKIVYWNFLPPDELESLLRLYTKVSHKTLRISKTFGIEGKKLLRPEDDYDALKDFNHSYEGTTTPLEEMHLEYQQLFKDYPDLAERLAILPGKVFSGKEYPGPDSKGVFFCYSIPALNTTDKVDDNEKERWTEDAGFTRWYLYNLDTEQIIESPTEIINIIRSAPDTPRRRTIPEKTLSDIRKTIEKYIKNKELKKIQAPVGVKATLKAWMELS